MTKIEQHDKKSMSYFPTPQEMGYSMEEYEAINFDNPKEMQKYDSRLESFQSKHREKLRQLAISTQEKKLNKYISHWYGVLKEDEISYLVENSRKLADEVIDKITASQTLPRMIRYYEDLRIRVKTRSFQVLPADEKKKKRFPSYDHSNKKLYGSVYSYARLWGHVFAVKNRRHGGLSS